jgi:hypothetical protein
MINKIISKFHINRFYKILAFMIATYIVILCQLDISDKQILNLLLTLSVIFLLVENF